MSSSNRCRQVIAQSSNSSVAGAVFGEVEVSLFVAGAILGEVQVSLFVAGAVFGEFGQ